MEGTCKCTRREILIGMEEEENRGLVEAERWNDCMRKRDSIDGGKGIKERDRNG